MAYVSPSNKTTGDLITAADWNQDIVANSQAGVPDIFTTAGDLAYATGADAATRLAIGTSGYILQSTGSAPSWVFASLPQLVRLTSQADSTGTSLANVTGFAQAITASSVWHVVWNCGLSFTSTGGYKFAVTVPSGATLLAYGSWQYGTSSTATNTTSSGTAFSAGGTSGAGTGSAQIYATVVNSTNAGNIQLQFAESSAAGTSSILVNSIQIGYRIS